MAKRKALNADETRKIIAQLCEHYGFGRTDEAAQAALFKALSDGLLCFRGLPKKSGRRLGSVTSYTAEAIRKRRRRSRNKIKLLEAHNEALRREARNGHETLLAFEPRLRTLEQGTIRMLEHEWDETKRASLWDILARIRAALTEIETAKACCGAIVPRGQ
jgi:hypothetical protein